VIVRFPKDDNLRFACRDIVHGDFTDEVKYHLSRMAMVNNLAGVPVGKSWGSYEAGKYNWSCKRISESTFKLCFHALETGQTIPSLENRKFGYTHRFWATDKYAVD
jgi:hypothetical protein